MSIKGWINFLQPGRFSTLCEQTCRNQFAKKFEFLAFNTRLINQTISDERVKAFVSENAEQFKAFSNYIVADAYFSKRPMVTAIKSSGLDFISRLRDDRVLKYKFTGERTGKKGAPKKFAGLVDVHNFNPAHFSLDLSNEEITINSLVVYSRAFKWTSSWPLQSFTKKA